MASVVTDKVFEKKYTKLKVFIRLGIRYGIYMAVLFGLLYVYMMNKHVEKPLEYTVYWWLALLVICIVGIITKMAREKDIAITVMSKTVDITVGSANDVYPVQNYVGPNFNLSKKKHNRHELIFDNPEDPESNLIITLPGVPIKQFKNISDAIMIAKQELSGEAKYEAFEGDLYERDRKPSVDGKTVAYILLAAVGTAIIIGCELAFLANGMQDIGGFVVGMFFLFLFYIFMLVKLIRYLLEREPKAQALKSLKFESNGFTINGTHYSYKEIETVTMTPPYLTDMSRYYRVLTIKLYDGKKPLRFSLGNRIEKNQSEKELAEGCTCIYPAIYERIKTDKALTRKFKL